MNNEQLKVGVLEPQPIKSTERAKRLLIPPVYSLREIRAYDELQIVVTKVGQVKQTVTASVSVAFQSTNEHDQRSIFSRTVDALSHIIGKMVHCSLFEWQKTIHCMST